MLASKGARHPCGRDLLCVGGDLRARKVDRAGTGGAIKVRPNNLQGNL